MNSNISLGRHARMTTLFPTTRASAPYVPLSKNGNPRSTAIARMSNQGEDDSNRVLAFFQDRFETADSLEIRLDATLAMCHVLARFLAFDMTLPKKDIPGFELVDIIMVLDTFTSAIVLAILWTMVGLITRVFEQTQATNRVLLTTALVAPIWLGLEISLGWPPEGVGEHAAAMTTIALGSLGLFGTMSLGRVISTFLR